MGNDELYDNASKAITELFNDTSVSKNQAVANLEALAAEIDTMIESLDAGG